MTSWLALKQLRPRRLVKTLLVLMLGGLVITQYQNCTPMGDANGVGNLGLNLVDCKAVPAPQFSNTAPGTLTGKVGLGIGSGTVLPAAFTMNFVKGAGRDADDNCNLGAPLNNGLNVNCNVNNTNSTMRVTITTDDEAECIAGTATVTLRIRDDLCRAEAVSSPQTLQLTVTNSCPPQQQVSKDGSVAPELTPERLDQFGSHVAISGTTAVVTALSDNQKASNAGAAFVYKWNGTAWAYQQKLMPAELTNSSELDAVAVSGNLIVLGAPYHGNYGAIFTYRFNGTSWVQSQGQIEPSLKNSAVLTQNFGYDIAISGSNVFVGSPGFYHNDPANFAKAGAVFEFSDNGTTLSEVRVLSAANKTANDMFGAAVAANGSTLAVGAPGNGKAFAYALGAYTETILNSNLPANSKFGVALDIGANRIVVGAPGAVNGGGNGTGAIVAFEAPAWGRKETIFGGEDGIQYGLAVAASGNDVLVGAPTQTVNDATRSGAAHLLRLDGAGLYKPYFIFRPRRAEQGFEDYFGESVALGNGYVLGGSRADDLSDSDMGSAFFIKVP